MFKRRVVCTPERGITIVTLLIALDISTHEPRSTTLNLNSLQTPPPPPLLGDDMKPKRVYGSYTLIGIILV